MKQLGNTPELDSSQCIDIPVVSVGVQMVRKTALNVKIVFTVSGHSFWVIGRTETSKVDGINKLFIYQKAEKYPLWVCVQQDLMDLSCLEIDGMRIDLEKMRIAWGLFE